MAPNKKIIPKIYMMIGNVGSGKSDLARHLCKKYGAVRVCMDDIVMMVHGEYGRYEKKCKNMYHAVEIEVIETAVKKGFDVVIDRTNLDLAGRARFMLLAKSLRAEVIGYLFPTMLDVVPEVLLKRRMKNPRGKTRSQWISIINKQAMAYEVPTIDEGFKEIVDVADDCQFFAVDFDGTIAKDSNGYPAPGTTNDDVIAAMRKFWYESIQHRIILWTCRHDDALSIALQFMRENKIPYDYVNENPHWEGGSRKVFAHAYLDDRNMAFALNEGEE